MATNLSYPMFLIYSTIFLILTSNNLYIKIQAQSPTPPPIVDGLSWNFYQKSCPHLETMIRQQLQIEFNKNIGEAAALLRIHVHDCFVDGCDGSVLLDGSTSGPGEKMAPPNLTLRKQAFKIIESLRHRVHNKCGRVVSCTDITALAARDAVFFSGGPDYKIPLGRRDSRDFATLNITLANLVPPNANTSEVLATLGAKNLDLIDIVALSGAHTIGDGHCSSFATRLYPTQDPTMDPPYAKHLKRVCHTVKSNNFTVLDIQTPDLFDNKYFVDLMNRQGLFTSDQDLYTDTRTRWVVKIFAQDEKLFFDRFVRGMIKVGQLSVLTRKEGEIRGNCSVRNGDGSPLLSRVDEEEKGAIV